MFEKAAPLTTSSTIIFPVNQKDKTFSRSAYSEAMTQGRVSSADINNTLCFFEVILCRITSSSDLKMSLIYRYFLPYVVLMGWKFANEINSRSFIWSWFWIYCICGFAIQISYRWRQVEKAKADLKGVIRKIQPAYMKKGLKWRVPKDPSVWIELVKEYRQSGEPLIPVVYQEAAQRNSKIVIEEQYKPLQEEVNENEGENADYTMITGPVVSYGFAEK